MTSEDSTPPSSVSNDIFTFQFNPHLIPEGLVRDYIFKRYLKKTYEVEGKAFENYEWTNEDTWLEREVLLGSTSGLLPLNIPYALFTKTMTREQINEKRYPKTQKWGLSLTGTGVLNHFSSLKSKSKDVAKVESKIHLIEENTDIACSPLLRLTYNNGHTEEVQPEAFDPWKENIGMMLDGLEQYLESRNLSTASIKQYTEQLDVVAQSIGLGRAYRLDIIHLPIDRTTVRLVLYDFRQDRVIG